MPNTQTTSVRAAAETQLDLSAANRILISELDSPAQRERFDRVGAKQAIVEITGMLRVGMLISRNVLVTDAMLLDGVYFAKLGPDRVLRELGVSEANYPLIVTGTASSLAAGLQARLDNPNFQWSLPGVSHNTEAPLAVQENWAKWIQYIDDGIIRYEQQTTPVFKLQLAAPPFDFDTPTGLVERLATDPVRSSAWNLINQSDLQADAKNQLRRWWNGGYLRLIAQNAAADWVTFESRDAVPVKSMHGKLQLPEKLVQWANEVNASTISVAWDSSRILRERLHKKPHWSRLRDLAYTATQVGEVVSRRSVMADSIAKGFIALIAILVAVPGLNLDSVDQPFTWVLFLGIVVTTLPYDSLFALVSLMKRDPRTALILYRRERDSDG